MNIKDAGDMSAVALAFGTVSNLLPSIAALLAIIWTLIRIYEWARVALFNKPKRGKFE